MATRFWICLSNLAGYRYARANGYDVAVQMDGDGQHDPAYLMQVVQPVLDGKLDMCIGSRFIKCEGFQTSFMRRVGIRFLSWLIHILCGQRILDVTSGFRATGPQSAYYMIKVSLSLIIDRLSIKKIHQPKSK
mgnify:CR=1 FL=1